MGDKAQMQSDIKGYRGSLKDAEAKVKAAEQKCKENNGKVHQELEAVQQKLDKKQIEVEEVRRLREHWEKHTMHLQEAADLQTIIMEEKKRFSNLLAMRRFVR